MMKKIIAYAMSAKDAEGYYFEDAPASIFCSSCTSCIRNNYIPKSVNIKYFNLDGSYTYDGQLIVSQKFKSWYMENGFKDSDFYCVDKEKHLFSFKPNSTLIFDVVKREVVFDEYCQTCHQYEEIAGANPVFLENVDNEILDGFFRTDVEFGSGREKSPIIILGTKTYKNLKKAKLTGFEFDPVYFYPDNYYEA